DGTEGLKLYYNCKETGHFHNNLGDTGATTTVNTQIAVFNPLKAGATLRGNPDLRVSISVEYINETDTHTDLKVGVFFNGKLYAGKYYTVKDIPKDELAKNLAFYVQNDSQYTIRSVGKICFAEKAPADRKNITLMDAGILDVKNSTFAGKFDVDSLDGTLFSAKIKYSVDNSRLHLGYGDEDLTFGGISFRLTNDKLVVGNEYSGREVEGYGVLYHMPSTLISLSAKTAGIGTSFVDTEFLLQASIDFVDRDGDGAKDDIKLGIFINDVLYNNMYFYILDDAENLGTRINFNTGKVASCASYNYEGYYDELTPESFGFGKTVSFDKVGNYDSETLDHTAITAMLKFPGEKGNGLYFGGENAGICLKAIDGGKISVDFVDSKGNNTAITALTPEKAGVSKITDNELKWRFAFRVTPMNDSSSYLKLSIYINGELYDGKVFTLSAAETASLKRTMSVKVAGGKFAVSNVKYEELSIEDFSVKNQNITKIEKKDWRTENYCDLETLDGTSFSAMCRFPKDGSARLSFGSPFWFGAFLSSASDGRIQVAFCDTDKTVKNVAYLEAETAGLSSF
ncbi:MAG: hypothetical protein IK086_06450, partial [Clostridia bacterium]|nr:hypothetical protein [Clostridia bacterium]